MILQKDAWRISWAEHVNKEEVLRETETDIIIRTIRMKALSFLGCIMTKESLENVIFIRDIEGLLNKERVEMDDREGEC